MLRVIAMSPKLLRLESDISRAEYDAWSARSQAESNRRQVAGFCEEVTCLERLSGQPRARRMRGSILAVVIFTFLVVAGLTAMALAGWHLPDRRPINYAWGCGVLLTVFASLGVLVSLASISAIRRDIATLPERLRGERERLERHIAKQPALDAAAAAASNRLGRLTRKYRRKVGWDAW